MTSMAQKIFMEQVYPLILATINRGTVKPVGSEDNQELVQDCLASAAQSFHALEMAGKPLLAKSTAFYAVQRCKSGRRSTSSSRTDALGSAAQLDGNSVILPLDEPMTANGEDDSPSLGEMLAAAGDDPCISAGRNIDWQAFLDCQDTRARDVVHYEAEGKSGMDLAEQWGVSPARVSQKRREVGQALRSSWGGNIMEEIEHRPLWETSLRVARVKAISHYASQQKWGH